MKIINIGDIVKAIVPGHNPDGVMVKIDSKEKWSDGIFHYGGEYKTFGVREDSVYNRGIQFTEDQCTTPELKEKSKGKLKEPPAEKLKETVVPKTTDIIK